MLAAMLKISNFSCGYPGEFKIAGVTFSLEKGMMAGIIGPNGSGKSTLLKGILGDIRQFEGEMLLQGVPLQTMKNREKARRIAVVSQHIEQVDIRVLDYVVMGRLPYKELFQFFETEQDYVLAKKYMTLTNVWHLKDKLLSELSGGEQQLAAIARALTQEPDLLLLDEPTSHLDITHQARILNLIQQLNCELNLSVLIIIHDLNLAAEYCDYLVLMKKGGVFAKGTPFEVLTYENIESVYQTVVITMINPLSGKPAVFLVSDKVLRKEGV